MKFPLIQSCLLVFGLGVQTMALGAQPDIVCRETSGFRYEFFFSDYREIHVFDEKGQALEHLDELKVTHKISKKSPQKEKYIFSYVDGGNQIAILEFPLGKNKGRGEMIDNDQKLVCLRK